ncbi:MAG TPA: CDP-diacylglycerol--serine O-phosphatidyltransferase [Pirellulales bacterium]|jgi:CDP-diacylglycerol---serine O-phosphatidyltransferase
MMARIRTVAVLPTMFTLANLVCGFFAIVVAARVDAPTSSDIPIASPLGTRSPMKAMQALDKNDPTHNVMLSGWLIFLAMLFDALDGHVARLSNWTSDFGAQLDSLSDLVTFGVAPAFLLVKMCPSFTYLHHDWAWVIAASYVSCAALRLARFTIDTGEDDDHLHFTGLPSPAAAASIAGFAIMFYTLRKADNPLVFAESIDSALQTVLPFFAALVALLMVSRIPYPHLVNQMFSGQRSLGHIVGLMFATVAIMVIRGYAVPMVCCGFVAMGPIQYAWQEYVDRQPHKDPLF